MSYTLYAYNVLYFTYNILHTYVVQNKTRYSHTQLYSAIKSHKQLYRAMNSYTQLYTAIQGHVRLYTAIKSYTELYRTIHKLPFLRVYFFDNTLLKQVKERMPSMRECRTITDIREIQKTIVLQLLTFELTTKY